MVWAASVGVRARLHLELHGCTSVILRYRICLGSSGVACII